jgi:two-component system cell cycle response regulator DivK
MLSRQPLILVVEDHEDSRAMLVAFLQMKGCQVIEAADGLHVTDFARTAVPDLILMDLDLPFVDGWQATLSLKADKTTRHIPVVAVSGNCTDPALKQKALRAGCEDCIGKPVDFDRLSKTLAGFLFRSAA